jgi:spore coat polysaccharide biosynthesis protein SpsF (cytidylyltransferase family)
MPDEWKTIRVPKNVYDDAKMRKEEHDVTWGEYVNPHAWHSVFDEPTELPEDRKAELTVTAEDLQPMIHEEIVEAMSEITIDVTIDENSNVNEDDVRNIVEAKLERLKEDLR